MVFSVLQVSASIVQIEHNLATTQPRMRKLVWMRGSVLPSVQMKKSFAWRPQLMKDIMIMSKSRPRPPLKRPTWIIALVSFVCVFFIVAYFYPPRSSATCYLFSSSGCTVFGKDPPSPARELTDDETASDVVVKEILKTPPLQSKNPKIAFMFLTPGTLPFEELWENFFQVRFCLYVILFHLLSSSHFGIFYFHTRSFFVHIFTKESYECICWTALRSLVVRRYSLGIFPWAAIHWAVLADV